MTDDNEQTGCLGMILGLLGIRPAKSSVAPTEKLPYHLRDDFLSAAERSVFGVLCQVVGTQGVVCPKVRVADLLFVADRRSNQGYVNRIDRKHVDFVICAPDTLTPRVVVELDDASHERRDRRERDEFVDAAFQAAGLSVVHITAKRKYAPAEIAVLVLPYLAAPTAVPAIPPVAISASAQRCPKCGNEMVLRTATQGERAGQPFYGCKSYPQCRTVLPVTAT